jgi:uncharacterized protein (DUF1684 family)
MANLLQQFRDEVDDFMQFHPQSPLEDDLRDGFKGLAYFDENPALVFMPDIERLPDDEPLVEMETSTGDRRLYRRYARLSFEVDGEPAALTVYSDPDGGDFFLPFRDATSGTETYGAGRYLDNHRPGLRPLGSGAFELDFNYAYNPYCAYSPYYSCPLPPRENWLKVAIRAGEKDFAH